MRANKETIARTICLIIALVNQVLAILGKGTIDIADDTIYQLVTLIFTVGASLVAWWKNNSFSHEAMLADEVMKELKARRDEVGGENSNNTDAEHSASDPEEV